MQRIFDEAGPGPVIIIGTDIPAITPAHIAKAFAQLRANDAVLGPTPDGGYWLVGLKRCPRVARPFNGVRWSSAGTLADTAFNLRDVEVAIADLLPDVDNAADLANCKDWFGRHTLPAMQRW
jgi:uncharacterized protein